VIEVLAIVGIIVLVAVSAVSLFVAGLWIRSTWVPGAWDRAVKMRGDSDKEVDAQAWYLPTLGWKFHWFVGRVK
jgi:hypothetical protein